MHIKQKLRSQEVIMVFPIATCIDIVFSVRKHRGGSLILKQSVHIAEIWQSTFQQEHKLLFELPGT